ncbi:glycosyltransferase family 2 protein [Afipia massiliensis]|uniref:Glycosyltransferase family 2 protein n=2 Tax=Afipia massiliensis TaxID=211460 RepID=A0A4U6BU28_9BRAD|nr:glycosyltransferase family 2 protein [Afipia massiliensis]
MHRIAILLATKDGERFLKEQLSSYARQTLNQWSLHVSDDGSSDATVHLVKRFAETQSRSVDLREGPRQGFFRNFMSLALDERIDADFYAFSDQDDIWNDDKLERAINWFKSISPDVPAVYFSRTELIDESGSHLGYSPLFERDPSFQNALVQNIGGGNTMVFNSCARRLLIRCGSVAAVSHDWWTYQIVTAAGGKAHYDPVPSLKYRQHSGNILGANAGLRARIVRLRMMLSGRITRWNTTNLEAFRSAEEIFSRENSATLEAFSKARKAIWPLRLMYLYKSGVYRQTLVDNVGLFLAVLLKRI